MSDLESKIRNILDRYDARSVIYVLEQVLHEELLKRAPRAIPCLQDAYRLMDKPE